MTISKEQHDALLRAPDSKAIFSLQRSGKSFAYMAQHAVRTELIRVFGFGGWSGEVLEAQLVSQREVPRSGSQSGSNWEVLWRVRYRLRVLIQRDKETWVDSYSVYTEDAVGSAVGPHLADVHDQALKSAESDAMKRCAVNLGSRFGLSLYFDGYTGEVVRQTIDTARLDKPESDDDTTRLAEQQQPQASGDEAFLNLSGPERGREIVEEALNEIEERQGIL